MPDVNEKDENGRTALHIACEYDNINVVEELIQANALPNIRAKDGSTALHVQLKSKYSLKNKYSLIFNVSFICKIDCF